MAGWTLAFKVLAVVLGEFGGERETGEMAFTSGCVFGSRVHPFLAPGSPLPSSSSSELMFSIPSWPLLSCLGAGGRGGKGGGASWSCSGNGGAFSSGGSGGGGVFGVGGGRGD